MLTYNKNVWNKGIAISPEKLNNIENGISSCVNAINGITANSNFSNTELSYINNIVDRKIAAHNIGIDSHNNRFDLKSDKSHRHNYGSKISDIEDRLSILEEKIDIILSNIDNKEKDVEEEIENAE